MNEKSDVQLLRDYAEHRDETAFREIVTRHTDFVYSAALRQVGSAAVAGDLAQSVFLDLARKAAVLTRGRRGSLPESLAGWLHRATRYAALNHLRDTHRRVAIERQAMEQLLIHSEPATDWERIRPALDEALDTLGDEDREALLLRYFKNQDFRTVGLALGVSDDVAQKRVSRAVERLREFFAKRGVPIGASGLVVVISANAVQAAPAGLAITISSTAVLAGTTFAGAAAAAVVKTIAMTTLQKALITTVFAVAVGAGIYEVRQTSRLRANFATLQDQQASLTLEVQQLARERDDATNRVAMLLSEKERLQRDTAELLRLRAEVGTLRQWQHDAALALASIQSRIPVPSPVPTIVASASANPAPFRLSLVLDEGGDDVEVIAKADGVGDPLNVAKTPLLDKTALSAVNVSTNALGMPQIEIEFSAAGAEQFAQITKDNLNKRLAILLDGKLYSAPLIRSEITGGKAQINGSFTAEEASELAARINAAITSK